MNILNLELTAIFAYSLAVAFINDII